MWPNFLIIGVQKSGTTSLYHYLNQHPQIGMSSMKEPHFFLAETLKKWQYYPGQKVRLWHNRVTSVQTYQKLFDPLGHQKAIGEASVWYLYRSRAAAKIKHYLPEAKLIAILRDPAERCFSDYKQGLTFGYETRSDFYEAILADQERFQSDPSATFHYVPQGFYYQQLKSYLKLFDHQQIRVYFYEDLKKNPEWMLRDIFRFLEVDVNFVPDISQKKNVSPVSYNLLEPKHKFCRTLGASELIIPENLSLQRPFKRTKAQLSHFALYNKLMRRLLALFGSERFRKKRAIQLMEKAGLMELHPIKPILEPHVRQELVEIYREDISKLSELLQRDLSQWLRADVEPLMRP